MFEAIRNNPKITQVLLALITLPFAFFGVEAYFRNSGPAENAVAKVGSIEISSEQLDQSVREQENMLREQLGGMFDKSYVERPEFKAAVLDKLVNETAIRTAVAESKLRVSDAAVQAYIKSRPEFQENGRFSFPLYEAIARNQGLTPLGFEARVREGLAQQQLMLPIAGTAYAASPSVGRLLALEAEERTVSELVFDAGQFLSGVKLSDDAARKYYDANQQRFQSPEQLKFEYVLLSLDAVVAKTTASEADARKWYEENIKNFEGTEERRASHILIQAAADAKAEQRAAARKKAEDLLVQIKATPAKFAALAKANSEDPGSAEKGGDLGFFARGAMVKPFEDAAFSLKTNEVSGVVESDFGYHIIMLTDSRGAKTKKFEEVKTEALEGARQQLASIKFAEMATGFGDMVYEQPDSLKPVAEKFELKLIQSDWTARSAMPAVLQNAKVQAALFSAASLQNRRNIEAIDLGNGSVISARIIEHKPAATRVFEEVKAQAETLAKAEEAARLAAAEGESVLKKLQAAESYAGKWKAARVIKRATSDFPAEARKLVFSASAEKLPAYVGILNGAAYSIYRIEKVSNPVAATDAAALKEARQQYALTLGQEDLRAYIAGVRARQGMTLQERK